MKAYESASAVAARKRVKKVHAKARFVGVLYTLGALALLVFTFLPILAHSTPIMDTVTLGFDVYVSKAIGFLKGGASLAEFIVGVLYIILLLTTFFNFFRCLFKLGWLSNRSSRYVNGYNKNMRAMEQMGERFAHSFARFVNFHIVTYILYNKAIGPVYIQTMAYAALAVGLIIHLIAGATSGKVSRFNVQGVGGVVEELKRECGLFVYFFRNLVQIAAIGAILYMFAPVSVLGSVLNGLLDGTSSLGVPEIMQALLLLALVVMVRHATADTEFNRLGIDGKGMKVFPIAALLAAVFAGVAGVLGETMDMGYIYMAAIALGAFLIHCIFKTRVKADKAMEQPLMWSEGR